jgi:hypothetical protein
VLHHEDLPRVEEALADCEREDHIVGYGAPGIADDVRVALLQSEDPMRVQARVHAGQDRDACPGVLGCR